MAPSRADHIVESSLKRAGFGGGKDRWRFGHQPVGWSTAGLCIARAIAVNPDIVLMSRARRLTRL